MDKITHIYLEQPFEDKKNLNYGFAYYKRLGYVCNPHSLKEGMEMLRHNDLRKWDLAREPNQPRVYII